jgi:hypothetical protein
MLPHRAKSAQAAVVVVADVVAVAVVDTAVDTAVAVATVTSPEFWFSRVRLNSGPDFLF